MFLILVIAFSKPYYVVPECWHVSLGVADTYVGVWQQFAKRAPDCLNLVFLTWIVCDKCFWRGENCLNLEELLSYWDAKIRLIEAEMKIIVLHKKHELKKRFAVLLAQRLYLLEYWPECMTSRSRCREAI